jgi:hypothetical protein
VVVEGRRSPTSGGRPAAAGVRYVQLRPRRRNAPPGPLAVTHVGGAGLTFPRYVEVPAGRPRSCWSPTSSSPRSCAAIPLPRRHRIGSARGRRVRYAGARRRGADLVVVDAYAQGRIPAELTTVGFLTEVRRVLRRDGVLLLNVADEPRRRFLGRVLATLPAAGYADRLVLATSEVLRGSGSAARWSSRGIAAERRGRSAWRRADAVPRRGPVRRRAGPVRLRSASADRGRRRAVPAPRTWGLEPAVTGGSVRVGEVLDDREHAAMVVGAGRQPGTS